MPDRTNTSPAPPRAGSEGVTAEDHEGRETITIDAAELRQRFQAMFWDGVAACQHAHELACSQIRNLGPGLEHKLDVYMHMCGVSPCSTDRAESDVARDEEGSK